MAKRKEEDPDKPFSVARVAVWALGVIGLISALGLIAIAFAPGEVDPVIPSRLGSVVGVSVGGLVAVAAARNR